MEQQNFEVLIAELEQVVEKLEAGEVSLEESVSLFEKGVGLTRQCAKILEDAQQKVTMLVRSGTGEVREEPFVGAENAGTEQ